MAILDYEQITLEGMNQSAKTHLQTAESHRLSYTQMTRLADEAEAGWSGEAAMHFKSALDSWLANYKVVGAVLDQMHQRIVATGNFQGATHEETTNKTAQVQGVMAAPVPLQGF
ncbi:hypothetical protein GCM10010377_68990 [Streptomyces viridiviolaceus]|uniref:WXG100 family type VII secretion target n=1 Tax=Streptomyces viridiviolaceus TaxID=68282 RepID=A0ABW2ECP9_9ACTN|nr:WXG100 family type VII secretion target [Streptomyces viridiviolaceus]GHB68370.1 hypothetical protein GCM10010377_68990 [Streptomyces viridiviolaceus]